MASLKIFKACPIPSHSPFQLLQLSYTRQSSDLAGSLIANSGLLFKKGPLKAPYQSIHSSPMSGIAHKIKDKMSSSSSKEHLAAILPSKGSPLSIESRPTPTPGPNELLISVSSIALNPIDWKQRDFGFALTTFPAVIGSDVAGTVVSAGSSVGPDAPKPGSRVTAFAPCFYKGGHPDYGALQTKVLVLAENAAPLPDRLSFTEASLLPMAAGTTWAGLYTAGVPRNTAYAESDKQGILVWGAASSVGSMVVQTAKLLGFRIYATASEKHHAYIKSLGASRMFDYKSPNVEESIVKAAKEDGVTVQVGYDAVGAQKSCMEILKQLKGVEEVARLASAPRLPEDLTPVDGVEVKFVAPPEDAKERAESFHFVFNVWLKEKLESGEIVPSPKAKVVDGGLQSVNKALDELKAGVSGVKLVLEV